MKTYIFCDPTDYHYTLIARGQFIYIHIYVFYINQNSTLVQAWVQSHNTVYFYNLQNFLNRTLYSQNPEFYIL